MKYILLSAIATLCFVTGSSQGLEEYGIYGSDAPSGIQKGAVAPDFTAKTADGSTFSLSEALKTDAVALVFYRGYWCGHCTRALSAYSDSLSYLAEMDVKVVAVTPETYENVAKTKDKVGGEIAILSDEGGEIMKLYDVAFEVTDVYAGRVESSQGTTLMEINGDDTNRLPIPATYLIVRDGKKDNGVVVWRHFDPDYSNRASVAEIAKALTDLN